MRRFAEIAQALAVDDVERLLDALDTSVHQITAEADGTVRFGLGDSYCVTFPDAAQMIGAADRLHCAWGEATSGAQFETAILIVLHRGDIHAFRSFLYGEGLVNVSRAFRAVTAMLEKREGGVFVTSKVHEELAGTDWESRLQPFVAEPLEHELRIYQLRSA